MSCTVSASIGELILSAAGDSYVQYTAGTDGLPYDGDAALYVLWTCTLNGELVASQCNDHTIQCGSSQQSYTDTFTQQGALAGSANVFTINVSIYQGTCAAQPGILITGTGGTVSGTD